MYLSLAFSEGRPGDWGGGSEGKPPVRVEKDNEKKNNKKDKGVRVWEGKKCLISTVSFPILVIGYTHYSIYRSPIRRYLLSEGHTCDIIRIHESSKQGTSHNMLTLLTEEWRNHKRNNVIMQVAFNGRTYG